MTFRDLKNLDYPDFMPIESVLEDLMYKGGLDFVSLSNRYVKSLEKHKFEMEMKFEEAALCISQILSGNFKKEPYKSQSIKRAIHIFNCNKTFVKDILNKQYGYTEEDLKQWDEFCKNTYGFSFSESEK